MREITFCLGCLALLSRLALGQPGDSKPAFEIADVHVSRSVNYVFMAGSPTRGPAFRRGHYEIHDATMVDLIRTAYGVDAERVLGGPSWLETDRYDVIAKAPAGTTLETARPMLQALLAGRFKLAARNGTRPVPAYALKAGRHPQLKPAGGSGDSGCKYTPPKPPYPAGTPWSTAPELTFSCRNMTMAAFAETTPTLTAATQYLNDRMVADLTELQGAWDFDFIYTIRNALGPHGPLPGRITIFEAMEKLGLRLEAAEVALPVILVDSVNRTPAANPPDTAEALRMTPIPATFQAATVKPTNPNSHAINFKVQPGGRVVIEGVPLRMLIQAAWNLTDEMLAGAPRWLAADRYDIVAKADVPGPEMEIEEVLPMLRALVVERFKLVSHMENRPAASYTLIAVNPKLKKADPASRTKWVEGPAANSKDPRDKAPMLARLVTVQNMTMARFAEKLEQMAPGYIHTPVLDGTGLEGGYDFTLSFSPAGATQAGGAARGGGEAAAAPPADAVPAASDPNGAVSLFDAIERQLGLKLKEEQRPVPVLVVDHIEQRPVGN